MPKKLEKCHVKLWVLANLVTKYVSDFEVYCGKHAGGQEAMQQPRGIANATYVVVMGLLAGLEARGHCLVLDNYFSCVSLFTNLVGKGIYATGISISSVLYRRVAVAVHEFLICPFV